MSDAAGELLSRATVRRVADALRTAGSASQVLALRESARTAADAAAALGTVEGAIVKSLVFRVGERPVLALVAGDRRADTRRIAAVLGLAAEPKRADAAFVQAVTGFSIGGVPPVGHPGPVATAIDQSLSRFARLYAAAGHPHCVFATSLDELAGLTRGKIGAIAAD